MPPTSRSPTPDLQAQLTALPDAPGVYLFLGKGGKVLYVGKAKSLKKRVRSYFQKGESRSVLTRSLMREVRGLETILTASEKEALVVENNLIKGRRPRYNVRLRDDKNYPYLCFHLTDPFPWVSLVRGPEKDGNRYFGPFIPAAAIRPMQRLLGEYFKLRVCVGDVKQQNHRACLYYHLNQCLAPCVDAVPREEYADAVQGAIRFLEGKGETLVDDLERKMHAASREQRYERAAYYRDLVAVVQKHFHLQRLARPDLHTEDVWHFHREGGQAVLQILKVRDGQIADRESSFYTGLDNFQPSRFLTELLQQYYHRRPAVPDRILLPQPLEDAPILTDWLREVRGRRVELLVPRRGEKRRLLELAATNAVELFQRRFGDRSRERQGVLSLQEALALARAPARIEGFDVSNIQGSFQVAACVTFQDGRADKAGYRHFRVRRPEGPDDFAALREVVERRYRRVLAEQEPLPDLILMDGGKGQLGAALEALFTLGLDQVPVASLAKREELVFRPTASEPLRLPRSHPGLQLLQRVRDEAHRFAVAYHRKLRSKAGLTSLLTGIPGVGPKTARKLLTRFPDLAAIEAASEAELAAAAGPRIATAVHRHFADSS